MWRVKGNLIPFERDVCVPLMNYMRYKNVLKKRRKKRMTGRRTKSGTFVTLEVSKRQKRRNAADVWWIWHCLSERVSLIHREKKIEQKGNSSKIKFWKKSKYEVQKLENRGREGVYGMRYEMNQITRRKIEISWNWIEEFIFLSFRLTSWLTFSFQYDLIHSTFFIRLIYHSILKQWDSHTIAIIYCIPLRVNDEDEWTFFVIF